MVEGGGATASFPVVFFDGEREMDIGDVRINPALEYKPFQLMLSQRIGISPNQISTYLVNRKNSHNSPLSGDRRRMPITGKVNFGSICRQKDCCFLVILKRSRKSRNRRERMINASGGGGVEFAGISPENRFSPTPVILAPENLVLLRRGQTTPFYDSSTPSELGDLDGRLRSFFKGYENPPVFRSGQDLYPDPDADPFRRIDVSYYVDLLLKGNERDEAFCEECWNAKRKGGTTSFHPCVNDPVITRFTTRLGPINRPNNYKTRFLESYGGSFF
ncbi:hypothetical protein PHJA_000410500 [Phtheirospermum japonicum]|uniref:DUF7138 domain-containing protein n=1 Tax=Phtheirospermum japonicum TaxID=374723 RepID=A0A830BD08_9LAMI|nr:hypothetical protein PHJA_000410500 [Phtheirospermum japonicum]